MADLGVFENNYVARVDTGDDDKHVSYFGHGGTDEVYKKGRPIPGTVLVDGRYTASGEERTIEKSVSVRDYLNESLREKLEDIRKKNKVPVKEGGGIEPHPRKD